MKTRIAVIAILLMAALAGCSFIPRDTVTVQTNWIPNTASNGMTHWLPGLIVSAEVTPEPEVPVSHSWRIVWGDGNYDEWVDDSHNQKNSHTRRDNTSVAIAHNYRLPGTYPIEVWYDDALKCEGSIAVELQESGISSYYNEAGEVVQVHRDPWTPE